MGLDPVHLTSTKTRTLHLPSQFEELVVSPCGCFDPSLPIAAARAGSCGLLDLTYLAEGDRAASAVSRLRQMADGGNYGLLLRGRAGRVESIALEQIARCHTILLSTEASDGFAEMVGHCRNRAARVGAVVTGVADAQRAAEHGVDFVVAKGHEAGGRVGEETTFVLLQRLLSSIGLPVFAWGGIGLHTAAACRIAGAAGVVLDWQLAVTRESPIERRFQRRLAAMDGSETVAIRLPGDSYWRFYHQPGMTAKSGIVSAAERLRDEAGFDQEQWDDLICERLAAWRLDDRLWPIGQDACFAQGFASQAPTVARALALLREHVERQTDACTRSRVLGNGGPLAVSHGTEFPIVQGPMTRVSDVPEFCEAVAHGGGLSFLALGLMRGAEVREKLGRTRDLMGDRPWGVGILGFAPRELQEEQMPAIREFRPPFAIIAGGRPDQAASLETHEISTYLHVPSPGMLESFIGEGARRFIFEGRECGGHVGPRTSFVLWDTMINVLLAADLSDEDASDVRVLFAGGVHDALSGSMVSAMAQPLVERGMKVGVLLGTGYLFTQEIVQTGAAVRAFQDVTARADHTVVLEAGPGHEIRCAETMYAEYFETHKSKLRMKGCSTDEIRERLEEINRGRLRIASKGVTRRADPETGQGPCMDVPESDQRRDGMYMLGQIAALRDGTTTIRHLHEEVCDGTAARLDSISNSLPARLATAVQQPEPRPFDVAVIGMACMVPGALNVGQFWANVLAGRDCIGEIPRERFESERWFDADQKARDKICSKWGGFLPDVPFDPLKYGIPPAALRSIEPVQLLALLLVEQALCDAGYAQDNPHKERTSVVLGVGGGAAQLGGSYAFRSMLPEFFDRPPEALLEQLPEWTEDSFAGILLNVVAGRVSNRFDLGGANFTVDAACASSLAAVYLACRELAHGDADMVVTGGCDTNQNPFSYLCFSKTGALSPRGRSRAFDASADGIVISEGHAAVVLKRREDAERDGDRIYALIRAVAAGSDGRSMGLTAPRREGQLRTLERAYRQAGLSPATVGLFESHGTGTAVGDQTESLAVSDLLTRHDAQARSSAIGSVKSMIGHTKCAAGVIGLIKAALSLHHRVFPPTIHVEQPNPKAGLEDGPLYVSSELRPWIRGDSPRRAGVSAFGFGGSNFHAVLEEYDRAPVPKRWQNPERELSAELFVFRSTSREGLARSVESLTREISQVVEAGRDVSLADLAYSAYLRQERTAGPCCGAVVAATIIELLDRLAILKRRIEGEAGDARPRPGVHFHERPLADSTPLAFLFPGQGSQFPDMLRDLAVVFREVGECVEQADEALRDWFDRPLSSFVFPPPVFSDRERDAAFEALKRTDLAQGSLGACDVAMLHLLESFGVTPDMVAGHSYGELVALHAAGAIDERELYGLSAARGRSMLQAIDSQGTADLGQMVAVLAGANEVRDALSGCENVWIANLNSPGQTVISGTSAGIEEATSLLGRAGLDFRPVPVACAFHSPLMAPARELFAEILDTTEFASPRLPAYSNTTAEEYPPGETDIRQRLADQLVSEVRFTDQIRAMHSAGARVFVEAGPNYVLTRFVDDTLADVDHAAIATNRRAADGLTQFLDSLAALSAHGVQVDPARLYEGRDVEALDLRKLAAAERTEVPNHVWLVNGSHVRPASEPPVAATTRLTIGPALETRQESDESGGNGKSQHVEVLRHAASGAHGRNGGSTSNGSNGSRRASNSRPTSKGPSDAGLHPARPQDGQSLPSPHTVVVPSSNGGNGSSAQRVEVLDPYAQFQETMRCFLRTQQEVMQSYFGTPQAETALIEEGDTDVVGVATEPISDHASGNGHARQSDSPASSNAAMMPEQPEASTDPPEATDDSEGMDPSELQECLIAIASERTGYPPDMLSVDANLEADLGIDSIKRVEIIAAFRRQVLPDMEEPPSELMDRMAAAKSMSDILEGIGEYVSTNGSDGALENEEATTVSALQSADELLSLLVNIVSERTGYPVDMLNVDANLEGDLGIDSIKRVEIVAAFRREVLPDMEEPPPELMDRMAGAESIQDILDGVLAFTAAHAATANRAAGPVDAGGNGNSGRVSTRGDLTAALSSPDSSDTNGKPKDDVNVCPRCVAAVVDAPFGEESQFRPSFGVYVLTNDGRGLSKSVAAEINSLGGKVELLETVDLASAERTASAIERLRRTHGRIAGLLHLLPLSEAEAFPGIEDDRWERHTDLEVKGLLFLLQAMAPELDAAGQTPVNVLCASTGGGDFSEDRESETVHPWRGGLAGMMKVAACEWPDAHFRMLDADALPAPADLLRELNEPGSVDVGYRDGRRYVVQPVRKELPETPPDGPITILSSEDVVLVTGGARGITAQVAQEIAGHTQARFVLLGRSARPDDEEDPVTALVSEPRQLRKIVLDRMRDAGETPAPKQVEAEVRQLLAAREIRQTLVALRESGSQAEYVACDVSDTRALTETVRDVQTRYGRIDAVVHGAGVIEDRYLIDKTPESFDRVTQTKIRPLLVLSRLLVPEKLKWMMLFSSTSGFFGNPGQCDYASANETLNRMARRLNHLWPGKVVAMNWGPWSGAGMVTAEVAEQFESRGIGMVTVDGGRRAAWKETISDHRDGVRVIVGPGAWVEPAERSHIRDSASHSASHSPSGNLIKVDTPLLAGHAVRRRSSSVFEAEVALDARRFPYLDEHRIDDKPVLPLAVAMEFMVELATAAEPDMQVNGLTDVQQFSGIVLKDKCRDVLLRAEPVHRNGGDSMWQVQISDPSMSARPLYEATVRACRQLSEPPPAPSIERLSGGFPLSVDNAYLRWLFHGPSFHLIQQLHGLDEHGIDATVQPSCTRRSVGEHVRCGWLIDAIALDVGPQLAALWSRAHFDTTPLPSRVKAYDRYGAIGDAPFECIFRTNNGSHGSSLAADVWFVRDGKVIGRFIGLECSGSHELNRITGRLLR